MTAYVPTGRQAVYLTGEALQSLLTDLTKWPPAYSLRISQQDGLVKWKLDEGVWTPGFPQPADPIRTH
jgi:hypothetical protein